MKKHFILLIIICGGLANSLFAQISEESLKFGEVLDKISRFYVDTVNETQILDEVLSNMLHELDPHSAYLKKDDVSASQEQLDGGFEGIGVSYNILRDTIFIVNPIVGGPSERVGILPGDRIILIDGENVAGIGVKNIDVQKKLKGPKNTRVDVSILRKRNAKLLEFTITRDKIPIYSLDASYMIDNQTGYIKLSRFSSTTVNEFNKAIRELKKQEMKNLILDLSGNGGGYLFSAINLADQFLPGRRKIVYTEGTKNPRRDFYSTNSGEFIEGSLVVMIDETSASASEIVSGAIQDWDRGVIVGRRSFGKGLVQGRFELRDGSELRLTVAKYYTPTGRLIQKSYQNGYDEYSKDLLNRYNSGELSGEEKIDFPDSLKFKTLVKGRTVYGGGGISPDYFVRIDTSYYSDYYRDLISKGILNQFVLSYVDKNRKELEKKYLDFNVYNQSFTKLDDLIDDLIKFAEKEGLKLNETGFDRSEKLINLLLKAYIARDLWDTNEFFRIYNEIDPIFIKAKEISSQADLYEAKLEKN